MPLRRPDPVRLIVCGAIALAGLVFFLQGLGVPIGDGFMVGDRLWAVIGAAMIVVAGFFAARTLGVGRH